MPTLFAGKLHAILCRTYEKGRDWYDLIWYLQRSANINFVYLRNALVQTGHIKGHETVDAAFVKTRLKEKLEALNFKNMLDDIRPLAKDRREIDLWTREMFFKIIEKLGNE